VNNNENYWNGVSCQSTVLYGQSCTADYMCQTLTQGTICNATGSNYTCQCPYLQYFDYTINRCLNQLMFNKSCNSAISNVCQGVFGLSCVGGICEYKSFLFEQCSFMI